MDSKQEQQKGDQLLTSIEQQCTSGDIGKDDNRAWVQAAQAVAADVWALREDLAFTIQDSFVGGARIFHVTSELQKRPRATQLNQV